MIKKKPKFKDYPPSYPMKRIVLEFHKDFGNRVRVEAALSGLTIKAYITKCILEHIAKDIKD